MSMVGNLMTVSDATIDRLLVDPESVTELLHAEEPPGELNEGIVLYVDKAWHGIHFLLTGSAWEGEPPLDFIVCGGTPIGEVDVGYGPARAVRAQEVTAIHDRLAEISREVLASRFDAERMKREDIYPNIWDEGGDDLEYLLDYYDQLKGHVEAANRKQMGLLVWFD